MRTPWIIAALAALLAVWMSPSRATVPVMRKPTEKRGPPRPRKAGTMSDCANTPGEEEAGSHQT